MKGTTKLDCRSTISLCFLIALPLVYFSNSHIYQLKEKFNNLQNVESTKGSLQFLLKRIMADKKLQFQETIDFGCHSDGHTDICISSNQVKIDTRSSIIYIQSNSTSIQGDEMTIQPYPRKDDQAAMNKVSQFKIYHQDGNNRTSPVCDISHDVPAVLFSSGGFTGNIFHEFNEVIIPLFITTTHFKSDLQFVVSDYKFCIFYKYKKIFPFLSRYNIIDATKSKKVHCFPGAVIGLMYHDNLAIDDRKVPGYYNIQDFRRFLVQSFGLRYKKMTTSEKPKLVLISRDRTRVILNEDEVVKMMEELGFEVTVRLTKNALNLEEYSELLNSCSVMVGAHGAGLTNELFLPNGAVVVQVIPYALSWAAETYYGCPAKAMGLNYLEYEIEPQESSLYELYGPDHPVVADPNSVFAKGYIAARDIYIDGQNMTIDVTRFRKTLSKAISLVGSSNLS